jgi:hypothetical protein
MMTTLAMLFLLAQLSERYATVSVSGWWLVKGAPSYVRPMRVLPGCLWGVLAILFVQIILNVFGGSVLLYALASMPADGALYFVVWFGLLASAVLAVSALFLVLRYPWARYPVVGVEALAMGGGLVALVTGTSTGLANVFFGFAVLVLVYRPEVRTWLTEAEPEMEYSTGPAATYGWARD